MTWLDDLGAELAAAHVPARRRRRILAELDDHLRCDTSAAERLGDPPALARRFADELGTALSRQAAFGVFLALAPFGLLFGVVMALLGAAHFRGTDGNLLGPAVILGTQIAFVGGSLAVLRAWRLRHATVVSAADAEVLLRRAGFGLAGGLLTVGGIFVGAAQVPEHVSSWFAPLAYATAALGALTLAAAGGALVRAHRLKPIAPGPATGDLETDLGPIVPAGLRGKPWRLALAIAGLVALCIAVAGVVQSDPFDGVARALFDATACLAGFAFLGRWLGMRS